MKKAPRVVLSVFFLFSLLAAATAFPQTAEMPAWTKGVDTLTYYNAGSVTYDPAIVEGALNFESAYGIKVKVVGIPEENYVSNAARLLATGDTTYDVFDMYMAFPMPDWAARGWVVPIDDVVSPLLASKWPKGVWQAAEYQGKHYFVPHLLQPALFYWNKKLFKEVGLNPDQPPRDWNELVEFAKKLTKEGQWGFVYPCGKIERAPILFYSYFLGMNGGQLWNKDGSPAFNGDKGVEALQFMVDLIHKYKVTPEGVVNWDTGMVCDIFKEGTAAMAMHHVGHPLTQDIEALGLENLGAVAPPPSKRGSQAIYPMGFVGPTMYVNAKSKHLEAAKHLAAYMGSYIQSWREVVVENNDAPNLDIWESPYLQKVFPYADQHREVIANSYVPIRPNLLAIMEHFKQGIQDALTQKKSPKDALDWVAGKVK
jgi:ABC-type glycerol-3-phosphate transport system substrate-binding protein